MIDKIKQWITINHQHVPIKEGESKKEVVSRFKNQKRSNYKTDVINKDKEETSKEHLERGKREIPKVRRQVEKHYKEELEKLKGYIRDNYDNPEDYLKDLRKQDKEALKGTRREKFDRGNGKDYFDLQRKSEENYYRRIKRLINEIKKEDAENDRIIAEYERKKRSNH